VSASSPRGVERSRYAKTSAHATRHPAAGPAGRRRRYRSAGDPPVPITVWRTPAGDGQASVPFRLAERLVSAYSRPDEVVIDVTDDHALSDAAGHGGRRHHPGWFTDASTLIIGPP
jgi:hypothetical protein